LLEGTYPGASGDSWCDTDFAKRIDVNVDNTAGSALTDYQVYMDLTSNPINETSLRVYNTTSCALRSHWCEEIIAGNCTKLWINHSAITSSSWTNNTAIYYGYAIGSTISNGTNTFEFFSDYNDEPNWTDGTVTTVSAVDNRLRFHSTSSSRGTAYRTFSNIPVNSVIEWKGKEIDISGENDMYFVLKDGSDSFTRMDFHDGDIRSTPWATTLYAGSFNTEYIYKAIVRVSDSKVDHYVYDTNYIELGSSTNVDFYAGTPTAINRLDFGDLYTAGVCDNRIEWIRIRKYASPEPSASLGSEELGEGGIPAISNKQPTPPITKSPSASDFEINATISMTADNHWEIDRTGSYEHLEWDNGTTAPAYTFSPATEGNGSYTVKLTAFNITDSSKNRSTTWAVTVANISISSPSPGTAATVYVSNRTITYLATINRNADCKWTYQNGTFIEWDNNTASPSTAMWINSSSVTSFNITLTAYDVDHPADNNSVSWNNSVTDDIFNSNYTWERLSSWDKNFVGRVGNLIVGDVDNDGINECIGIGSQVEDDILIQELDGTYTLYENEHSAAMPFLFGSVHNVDADSNNELMTVYTKAGGWEADLFRFNTTSVTASKKGTRGSTKSSNPKDIAWINISNQEHFYTTGCGDGDTVDAFINFTTHSFNEIDDYSNSGESTMAWDIDNDGDLELINVEGWAANAAKVWLYELNYTTGDYTSKTMLFDNDLANGQHYTAEVSHGDIDNDGIDNLIIIWRPTHYGEGFRMEAYEFDGIYQFGEGNYSEGFFIDDLANNSQIGFSDGSTHAMFVADVDADSENELLLGTERTASKGSYLFRYDVGTNGTSIDRTTITNFSSSYFSTTQYFRTLTPNVVEYDGKTRIVFALNDEQGTTGTTELFKMTRKEEPATTPSISNVVNGSISPTSQYINWTVNQTTHNRVVYSNESDLTPAHYSTWDNSTDAPNITLSALTASTQYWYQAWSYNITNNSLSDNSSTLSFTTAAVDTSFTVTLPSGYTYLRFEPTNATATNVTPNGQTDLQEFYNVTNTGDVNLDVRLQLNETVANIILKADSDSNSVGAKEVNTTLVTIHPNLATANTADIWLWSDFNYAVQQDTNKTIRINVTQSP
jgi:hypothetical protein